MAQSDCFIGWEPCSYAYLVAGEFKRGKDESDAWTIGGRLYSDLVWSGRCDQPINLETSYIHPEMTELIKGVIAFAALWLGVGLLGNFVWLPWLLIPSRLWLWIPGSIILLPWFFAVGEAAKQADKVGQIGLVVISSHRRDRWFLSGLSDQP